MTSLLLLDVDGVVNALGAAVERERAWPEWQQGWATAEGRDFPITWAPSVLRRLLSWHDSGACEVQWLTTWGHDANTSLRQLLGVPELVVAGTYADGEEEHWLPPGHADVLSASTPAARDELTGRWWKFDVVRRIVSSDPDRRLVWIDDDLAAQDDIRQWTREHADCLLVAPVPTVGLTPVALAEVAAFLG